MLCGDYQGEEGADHNGGPAADDPGRDHVQSSFPLCAGDSPGISGKQSKGRASGRAAQADGIHPGPEQFPGKGL